MFLQQLQVSISKSKGKRLTHDHFGDVIKLECMHVFFILLLSTVRTTNASVLLDTSAINYGHPM